MYAYNVSVYITRNQQLRKPQHPSLSGRGLKCVPAKRQWPCSVTGKVTVGLASPGHTRHHRLWAYWPGKEDKHHSYTGADLVLSSEGSKSSSSSFEFEFELARSFVILSGSKPSSCLMRCSFASHLHKLLKEVTRRKLLYRCSLDVLLYRCTRVTVTQPELPELGLSYRNSKVNSTFFSLRAT